MERGPLLLLWFGTEKVPRALLEPRVATEDAVDEGRWAQLGGGERANGEAWVRAREARGQQGRGGRRKG